MSTWTVRARFACGKERTTTVEAPNRDIAIFLAGRELEHDNTFGSLVSLTTPETPTQPQPAATSDRYEAY